MRNEEELQVLLCFRNFLLIASPSECILIICLLNGVIRRKENEV